MNYLIWAIVLLLVLAAVYFILICPRLWNKPDYSVLKGVHYAHRGLHDNQTDAPENSLKAFEKAVDAGYGIEFDVQLSKDYIPVIFHDATLERMCGIQGNVWDYTAEELQAMKLADSAETIPTLARALELIGGRVPLIIEYKLHVPRTEVCQLADEILQGYQGIYCIESFHPLAVTWYRTNRPEIIRGQLSKDFTKDEKTKGKLVFWALTHLLTNVLTRPDFIAYNYRHAHMLSRRICRKLGSLAIAYTVRDQQSYEKVKKDFDLFIFDSFIPREK